MFSTYRTTLCREGWYYAIGLMFVFSLALIRDINLLILLSGLMMGPLMLSGFLTVFTLRGLQVRRKMPRGVCAGDLLVSTVILSNTRRRLGSWAVEVQEPIERVGNGKNHRGKHLLPSIFFPYLPAGQLCKSTYRGRLAERGRYRLGPMRLSTRFPFGLFCHRTTVGPTDRAGGFPAPGRLTPRLGRAASRVVRRSQAARAAGRRRRRLLRHSPLRGGDTRRWIHWRTSARAGKLMVRQFEQPRNRDVALLLDSLAAGAAAAGARKERRVGRQFRGNRDCRLMPQGRQQRLPGRRRPAAEVRWRPGLGPLAARDDGAIGRDRAPQRRLSG